jgi:hypothetical protein
MLEPLGARFPPLVFNPNDAAKAMPNHKMISDRLQVACAVGIQSQTEG